MLWDGFEKSKELKSIIHWLPTDDDSVAHVFGCNYVISEFSLRLVTHSNQRGLVYLPYMNAIKIHRLWIGKYPYPIIPWCFFFGILCKLHGFFASAKVEVGRLCSVFCLFVVFLLILTCLFW